ncbi:GNAT family N-acetyltransferase [Actinoplanes sp. L3-i22]|uniref:GNAT family N-acetyltransferase n=1 Tax=Actinoplanes sp. L3-i22 TaxID=2836373 RepID=UPI001C796EB8|nr:GNAT family N-acetyltransferase [Actinoplanes sp. L3-i22]BCY13586.1 N-acetyltransferase [Actinoplanes sp. L3-i22]
MTPLFAEPRRAVTDSPMAPRLAGPTDLPAIVDLIDEASSWLATKGTDQWARPWPSPAGRDARIRQGLRDRATWIIREGDFAAATVTVQRTGAGFLWTPEELAQPAVYVHRLIVARKYAGQGLGAALVDWASESAARSYGARCTRIDVWTTNTALHGYYKNIGFDFVRYANVPGYPSSALFERTTP